MPKDVSDSDEDCEQGSMKEPEQGAKDLELEQSLTLTEFYAAWEVVFEVCRSSSTRARTSSV